MSDTLILGSLFVILCAIAGLVILVYTGNFPFMPIVRKKIKKITQPKGETDFDVVELDDPFWEGLIFKLPNGKRLEGPFNFKKISEDFNGALKKIELWNSAGDRLTPINFSTHMPIIENLKEVLMYNIAPVISIVPFDDRDNKIALLKAQKSSLTGEMFDMVESTKKQRVKQASIEREERKARNPSSDMWGSGMFGSRGRYGYPQGGGGEAPFGGDEEEEGTD